MVNVFFFPINIYHIFKLLNIYNILQSDFPSAKLLLYAPSFDSEEIF